MRTDLFDYELPHELIAQEPADRRDQARLMVLDRARATMAHHLFSALPGLLAPADLLVLNNTRVLPARLIGRRERTGGRWEGLFLRETAGGLWELLSQTRGRLREGETICVEPGPLRLSMVARTPEKNWLARPLGYEESSRSAIELLERHGNVPLPPYIRKGRAGAADRERYQTIFAERPGAVAAPTAGLHFTPAVLEALAARGIDHCFITLHVGVGTFRPIQSEEVEEHRMHHEWGELAPPAAVRIAACRAHGGRVVAVGTTSVRVLETVAATAPMRPWSGETDLYIYPPYRFQAVDAMITNFHLPRSTLLLMVSAFGGIELIRRAYESAVQERYRFYSYGDAMLIV